MSEQTFHTQAGVEEVVEIPSGHHGPFYLQAEFWLAIAFLLVVAALFKIIRNTGKALIAKRIETIRNNIDEALRLKDEAQRLLSEYTKKFGNAETEAAEILAQSKKDLERLKQHQLAELEKSIDGKEKETLVRLESARKKASDEVIALTSQTTIATVKKAIEEKLDGKSKDKLIDGSISLIAKL